MLILTPCCIQWFVTVNLFLRGESVYIFTDRLLKLPLRQCWFTGLFIKWSLVAEPSIARSRFLSPTRVGRSNEKKKLEEKDKEDETSTISKERGEKRTKNCADKRVTNENNYVLCVASTCPACSKLTIWQVKCWKKKVWNKFKVNNKNARMTSLASFWRFYYKLWLYFTSFSDVYIVDFEQVRTIYWNYNDFWK